MKKDKNSCLTVSLDADEKLKVRILAAQEGLTMSEWIRHLIARELKCAACRA